ncbi:COG4315 family predicted lipoprotein [Brevundimonas sp. TSRC1-1]|uniref:COG4315 family predicted lipoprotein n=1 Tax=Brevundimonas sp. TSRC1-1 TaxID=2804562 RepID=UPI003CFAEBA6
MITRAIIATVFALSVSTAALAADPARTGETAKGPALTNAQGMTLYTFDKDSDGKSVCNGPCAANWPPFAADADAQASGSYTVVIRDDGSRQWAYQGRPLYTWAKDAKPGDITGDGVLNGAWRIAQP